MGLGLQPEQGLCWSSHGQERGVLSAQGYWGPLIPEAGWELHSSSLCASRIGPWPPSPGLRDMAAHAWSVTSVATGGRSRRSPSESGETTWGPSLDAFPPRLALGSLTQDPELPHSREGECWGGAQELLGVRLEGGWGLRAGSWYCWVIGCYLKHQATVQEKGSGAVGITGLPYNFSFWLSLSLFDSTSPSFK